MPARICLKQARSRHLHVQPHSATDETLHTIKGLQRALTQCRK